jgi:hypothetical protein
MVQLKQIAETVKAIVGHEYLYFDSAIQVKLSPHSHPVTLWGVCVSPLEKVYVMDSDEQWHEVKAHKKTIIASLFQRVQLIALHQLKTA